MTLNFKINSQKITHYLLSDRTKESAGKNKFLINAGYRDNNWKQLEQDILQHPLIARLEETYSTEHGITRVYLCYLPPSPNGRRYCVKTVWMEKDGGIWFITLIPQTGLKSIFPDEL